MGVERLSEARAMFAIGARQRERSRERASFLARDGAVTTEIQFREAAVEGDVLKGVILIRSGPGNLGDRHFYTPECLASSVSVFEGERSYLDHPTPWEDQQIPGRSVTHLGGWFSDVRVAPYTDPKIGECSALYADFHPQIGREDVTSLLRTCVDYAKKYPSKAYVGLSINAIGEGRDVVINGEEWHQVDSITEVDSIDIVTRAGAGGTFLPLREAHRMATKPKTKIRESVTVDPKKVEAGVKSLRESAKAKLLETIKGIKIGETAVTLTPEQDQALDTALGIVNGGAIDKIIDSATGVADDGDEGDIEDGSMGEGVVDATMPATLPEAHAALKAERAAHAVTKASMAESARRVKVAESAATTNARNLRESNADRVIADLKIPESFAPRLRIELLERDRDENEMRDHAKAFDLAFIRPRLDGAGVPAREATSGATKIDFTFGEG